MALPTIPTRRILPFLLFLLLAMAFPALAQQGEVSDDEVNEVAQGLYCPVCESTPLDVCATKACADWRELIRTQLGEGQSKQEIYDYFALQYGTGVLAEPPKQGFGLILWVVPILALIIGGILFVRYIIALRSAGQQPGVATTTPIHSVVDEVQSDPQNTPTPSSPNKPSYLNQVEEELRKL